MGMPGFAHELELVGVSYTGTGVGQPQLCGGIGDMQPLHCLASCFPQPDVIQGGVSDWMATQLDPEVGLLMHKVIVPWPDATVSSSRLAFRRFSSPANIPTHSS